MSKQSEQILEEKLIAQLKKLGYQYVSLADEETLTRNLKSQLEKHNQLTFSATEFEKVLNTATQNGKKIAKPSEILNKETITKPFFYINSIYSLLGAIVILILINKKGIQITYFIFAGLLGLFFSLVGFYSLHEEILWNYNILLFNPLLLLFAYFYWKKNTPKTILFGQICMALTMVYLAYIVNKVQVFIVLPIIVLHLFWLIKIVMKERKIKIE